VKQIAQVLDAVAEGCTTSVDVEQMTGIPRGHASSYLSQFERAGLIRCFRVARYPDSKGRRRGRATKHYELREATAP